MKTDSQTSLEDRGGLRLSGYAWQNVRVTYNHQKKINQRGSKNSSLGSNSND